MASPAEPESRPAARPELPAERRAGAGETQAPREPGAAPRESRSARRAAVVRAGLEPLAPGELPPALLVSIAVAGLLGLINLVAYAAGAKIGGRRPGPGILSFSLVMAITAHGMWRRRYWAVLGFQALLTVIVLYFCLLLVVSSNIEALLLCLAVIGLGSWLFWKLVRVMARIQTPPPPRPDA